MTARRLHVPRGAAADGADPLLITPASAGWDFCGLRVVELAPGSARELFTAENEYAVLPLGGGCRVECDGRRFELGGRDDPFSRVSDFAYAPRDANFRVSSVGGARLALACAHARRRLDAAYGPAGAVPVEVRGAGAATRQVNNFLHPDAFPADRLICVELLTPACNWSSHPPHKHDADDTAPGEAILEEIYYFEFAPSKGAGLFGTYTRDGAIREHAVVRHGDAFLVPRGYHGPAAALPESDMYYLNVLAGPGEERSLGFSDDPAHAWIRESWASQQPDQRIPMTGPDGPVSPSQEITR